MAAEIVQSASPYLGEKVEEIPRVDEKNHHNLASLLDFKSLGKRRTSISQTPNIIQGKEVPNTKI